MSIFLLIVIAFANFRCHCTGHAISEAGGGTQHDVLDTMPIGFRNKLESLRQTAVTSNPSVFAPLSSSYSQQRKPTEVLYQRKSGYHDLIELLGETPQMLIDIVLVTDGDPEPSTLLEEWRRFIQDYHLIVIQQADRNGNMPQLYFPDWVSFELYTQVEINAAFSGRSSRPFDLAKVKKLSLTSKGRENLSWNEIPPSQLFSVLACYGLFLSEKRFVYFLDPQTVPLVPTHTGISDSVYAEDESWSTDVLRDHIINLLIPSTPFSLRDGFASREVRTAVSIGGLLHPSTANAVGDINDVFHDRQKQETHEWGSDTFDGALQRWIDATEPRSSLAAGANLLSLSPTTDGTVSLPVNFTNIIMHWGNVAVDRSLIGPAFYSGYMQGEMAQFGALLAGWCAKAMADRLGLGVKVGFPYVMRAPSPEANFHCDKETGKEGAAVGAPLTAAVASSSSSGAAGPASTLDPVHVQFANENSILNNAGTFKDVPIPNRLKLLFGLFASGLALGPAGVEGKAQGARVVYQELASNLANILGNHGDSAKDIDSNSARSDSHHERSGSSDVGGGIGGGSSSSSQTSPLALLAARVGLGVDRVELDDYTFFRGLAERMIEWAAATQEYHKAHRIIPVAARSSAVEKAATRLLLQHRNSPITAPATTTTTTTTATATTVEEEGLKSSHLPSDLIERAKQSCAIVTQAKNEKVILPLWLQYYLTQTDPEHLFVLDSESTDGSTDPSNIPEGVTVIPVRQSWGGYYSESNMNRNLEMVQRQLLRAGFKCVLITDTDELVAANAEKYASLKDYFEAFVKQCDSNVGIVTGYHVGQRITEPAINWSAPLLLQRSYIVHDTLYNKPLLTKVPVKYTPGRHFLQKSFTDSFHDPYAGLVGDPDLIMLHLHYINANSCIEHERAKQDGAKRAIAAEQKAAAAEAMATPTSASASTKEQPHRHHTSNILLPKFLLPVEFNCRFALLNVTGDEQSSGAVHISYPEQAREGYPHAGHVQVLKIPDLWHRNIQL